jgi:hypothetical protein
MRTYSLIDKTKGDHSFAFEIENAYVSRRTVARLLKQVDGVTEVRLGGGFTSSNDFRVEFKYRNQDYVCWEPFGDNSRYWIGPKDPDEGAGSIATVEDAFKHYRPPIYRAVIGDVLTLRLLKRLVGRDQG